MSSTPAGRPRAARAIRTGASGATRTTTRRTRSGSSRRIGALESSAVTGWLSRNTTPSSRAAVASVARRPRRRSLWTIVTQAAMCARRCVILAIRCLVWRMTILGSYGVLRTILSVTPLRRLRLLWQTSLARLRATTASPASPPARPTGRTRPRWSSRRAPSRARSRSPAASGALASSQTPRRASSLASG